MAVITKEICGKYYSLLDYGKRTAFIAKVAVALGESEDKWVRLFCRWSKCSYKGKDIPEETARTIASVMASYNKERYNNIISKQADSLND